MLDEIPCYSTAILPFLNYLNQWRKQNVSDNQSIENKLLEINKRVLVAVSKL